jgi:hypothetical protein
MAWTATSHAMMERSPPRNTFAVELIRTPPVIDAMKAFKVGDHVSWNSEAGRVSGRIVRVHTKDTNYKGYIHHASADDPQYEIKSDKTDHIALHKGRALRHLRR